MFMYIPSPPDVLSHAEVRIGLIETNVLVRPLLSG